MSTLNRRLRTAALATLLAIAAATACGSDDPAATDPPPTTPATTAPTATEPVMARDIGLWDTAAT